MTPPAIHNNILQDTPRELGVRACWRPDATTPERQWWPKAWEEVQTRSLSYGKISMLFNMTEAKNIYACTKVLVVLQKHKLTRNFHCEFEKLL